jgi:hypothetical protein
MLSIKIMQRWLSECCLTNDMHNIQIDYLDFLNIGVVVMKGIFCKQFIFASNGEIVLFEEGFNCHVCGDWSHYASVKTNDPECLSAEKLETIKDSVI